MAICIYRTYESRYLCGLGEYICLLLIVNLKISLIYIYLYIQVNTIKPNFHAKNIIWLKFTLNYSLFKFNYSWRHCSAISLTVVRLCVCTNWVCVCNSALVCKAVRLALSCQTSASSFPFIPIPWVHHEFNWKKWLQRWCKPSCSDKVLIKKILKGWKLFSLFLDFI